MTVEEQVNAAKFLIREQNERGAKWKVIEGFSQYKISSFGLVIRTDHTTTAKDGKRYHRSLKVITPFLNEHNYLIVDIKHKHHQLHRLLAKAFIPNPDNKPEVNHINGVRSDYRLENLEWVTSSENLKHAWDTGSRKRKLQRKQLIEI